MNGSEDVDILCVQCTRGKGYETDWKVIGGRWYCARCHVEITGNEAREKLKVVEARLAFIKTHRPEITHNEGTGQWFVTWTDEKGQSNEEFGLTFEEVLDNARVPEEQVREVDS